MNRETARVDWQVRNVAKYHKEEEVVESKDRLHHERTRHIEKDEREK